MEGQCGLCMWACQSPRLAHRVPGIVLMDRRHFMDRRVGPEAGEPSQEGRSGSDAGPGLMLPWREDFIVSLGEVQTAS